MITFYDLMRAAHVTRWHIVNTSRQQSLAEHHWLVTVIALELHKLMTEETRLSKSRAMLVLMALFHDVREIRTGDIPTPAKDLLRQFGGKNLFSAIDDFLMPQVPYADAIGDDAFLQRIVKVADAIEAAWFIHENGVGTHASHVARKNAAAMAALVEQFTEETGKDWFEPVNKVLMALGMPYLNRDLKITPP